MTWALGLDASLTHTALVLGQGDPHAKEVEYVRSFSIKGPIAQFEHEIARLASLSQRLSSLLDSIEEVVPSSSPRVLCLEAYSFASPGRAKAIAEWGGQIRLAAWHRRWAIITVPPSTLKKYVTDKGNVEKNAMMMEILDRWGYKATDDNNADAYALLRVGLIYAAHLEGAATKAAHLELFKKCSIYPSREGT